jgi:hypothetical protein
MATDPTDAATAEPPIELDDNERELVALELDTIIPALRGERRQRYERLRDAVDDGTVPGDLTPELSSLLELALQTARARQLYRAEGERILTNLLRRTPRGKELATQLSDVNKALRAVAGHPLESVQVRMRTLGHFTVTVATAAATVTLAVRPDSVSIDSVAVGEHG